MVEGFITWEMLGAFATLATVVYMVVEFTKEVSFLKKIPTRYYSAAIALILILAMNIHGKSFEVWDIILYILSAISISLTANGLSNFNAKKMEIALDNKDQKPL